MNKADNLRNFCIAWRKLIDEFAQKNYLCEHFSTYCPDGHPIYYDNDRVQDRLNIDWGDIKWPLTADQMPSEIEDILKLVEFVFAYISKPTETWYHQYCDSNHPTKFDNRTGRYEYTIEVNKMFTNFGLPFRLERGKVKSTSSRLMDKALMQIELKTTDEHLQRLIFNAIEDFQKPDRKRRYHALRSIVDAFERIKTIKGPDKKRSVEAVIRELSISDEVRMSLDDDMKSLTAIANKFCIRHHEIDKIPIEDDDAVEFLFYLYFNYVRFILKKHNLLKARKKIVDE